MRILLAVCLLSLLASACAAEDEPDRGNAVGVTRCSSADMLEVLEVVGPANSAINDPPIITSLDPTNIPDLIENLEDHRAVLNSSAVPPCGDRARDLIDSAMASTINGLGLLRDGDEDAAATRFETASSMLIELQEELSRLNP